MSGEEPEILELALRAMSLAMDEFISACIDENGNPRAPLPGDLAKAKAFLPQYCRNAFLRKENRGR